MDRLDFAWLFYFFYAGLILGFAAALASTLHGYLGGTKYSLQLFAVGFFSGIVASEVYEALREHFEKRKKKKAVKNG